MTSTLYPSNPWPFHPSPHFFLPPGGPVRFPFSLSNFPMTLRTFTLFSFLLANVYFSQAQPPTDRAAIQAIMDQQTRCWNKGNLECFMDGYWHSDSLMFIGKSGITYGFDNTLTRYQKAYPDRATMGKLHFEVVSLEPVGSKAYFMVGRWFLTRSVGDINGHFTLLFRKIDQQWRIVKDHSS